MKHGIQKIIAKRANISAAFLSEIFSGKKRPSWPTAKKLAEVTGTDPVWWLEGEIEKIKAALSKERRSGKNRRSGENRRKSPGRRKENGPCECHQCS